MDKNTILDYVTETPGNTNRAVLGDMLDSIGGSVVVEALNVTENGTYTAEEGYAYSPVKVNISSGSDATLAALIDGNLTSIDIPSGVTSIRNSAFHNCSNLASVSIPSSVISIGNGAFYDCSSLTSINIPSGITSISDSLFYGCSSLTSIDIPSSVTSILNASFCDCSSLTSITCNATSPPLLQSYSFFNVPSDCAIYVPAESVDAYKAASYWSARADYIQAIPSV